ncbi:hypothetical protein pdam_00024871 [Pocillopora damicornis]|uniref:Secreted protein n=1 Tax=Pocillopora damicornis TaxID=46731 RepID=A0A3M6TZU4_POCDA|nr:hypothetical protein pdam_00024871 [Pocillopora damicornis]
MALLYCLLAIQNLIVASQQLILDSACTGHGDLNLAAQQTSTSFSPVLGIFPTYRILVRIHMHQRNFPEAFFRRHLKMGRESIDNLLTLLRGYVQ